jgi:taurine--2-oxoglutarate transaminase
MREIKVTGAEAPMSGPEMQRLCLEHTLYSWSKADGLAPTPVSRAEGIYFWTPEGKRYTDWNSQLMSVNVGHAHPKVIAAMKAQLDALIFSHPGTATVPRARLGRLMAELTPGDIDVFFYTLGGAEANENAVRAARLFTKRNKVLSFYRSYHGGTHLTVNLTGDPRRWANEPAPPGVVHAHGPFPWGFDFGKTDAEITANHLRYLEDTIAMEGPESFAALIVETVTGTNGILIPPAGWLAGIRALCDKYGIMLICDEVMAGYGRTGRWYAFEHGGIVPDMVTMAKGLTSSYFPVGAVGMRRKLAEHFRSNVFWGGLTYNAHPVGLATAEAVLRVMLEEKIVENAARMEGVVREEMNKLAARHPTVKTSRVIGLFGIVELQKDAKGTPMAGYNGSAPAMTALAKAFDAAGIYTVVRWNGFMCNPPLTITEGQIRETFQVIDRCLEVTHAGFEG